MNSALYIGATGMKGLSEGMAVTTNNLANVSTIAYKHQDIQYSDLIYTTQAHMGEWWLNQQDSRVAVGQLGKGLQVETVRTIFQQGGMESSNTLTDLAISGKGFFQVTDGTQLYYTRAGDFRPDNQGILRNPQGLALNGWKVDDSGNVDKSITYPVEIDKFGVLPAKASTGLNMILNLGGMGDKVSSQTDPYFSLLQSYSPNGSPPLPSSVFSQSLTLYDAQGKAREVTVYFDKVAGSGPDSVIEYLVAAKPLPTVDKYGQPVVPPPENTTGLLMSGTITFSDKAAPAYVAVKNAGAVGKDEQVFVMDENGNYVPYTEKDANGNYVDLDADPPNDKFVNRAVSNYVFSDMSAFAAPADGSQDLSKWNQAAWSGGLPQFSLDGAPVTLNLGITGSPAGGAATANLVGTDPANIPSIKSNAQLARDATTGYQDAAPMAYLTEQDGYPEGHLSYYNISTDGMVTGYYSNGQGKDLWQIPLCRFTSEDGLRRQGNNLFAATAESGQMEMGEPGSENYGKVHAYNIELSNVDMATEMVNMIITQRGFQSNSKVVTTADQMLQKAIELKRS